MDSCIFGVHEHKPILKHSHHHHEHSHSHENEHSHDHRSTDKKVLKIALIITFITMIIEIVAGVIANSLALISDAIHMFTHSFALAISLVAIILASKSAPIEKTFGYYRVEILAAFINGITIAISVIWIVYEAIERFINPEVIDMRMTIITAIIGLIVNIVTGLILMKGDRENINLKSAFLHMLADALSSVAIVVGAIVVLFTNWYIIDTIIALFVAVIIAKWAYSLLKDSINILLESSPIEIEKVKAFLENEDGVIEAHDIHIWEITNNMYNLTAHIKLKSNSISEYHSLIKELNHKLEHKYSIVHTTFQPEWES